MLDRTALLTAALGHAARGWHVFPLRPDTRPGRADLAKRPAFPDHAEDRCRRLDPRCAAAGRHVGWEERATVDPRRIIRAWQTPYGIGIACGPSGLVVIDLDRAKPATVLPAAWRTLGVRDGTAVLETIAAQAGQPIPDTYTVTTGSGGTHLYFTHPTGPSLRNTRGDTGRGLGPLIDTRAHGGLVIAAGSTAAGHPYTVARDIDPVPLPQWLADPLRPQPAPPPGRIVLPADRAGRYAAAAIEDTLTRLTQAAEGGRNAALFMAAQTLGQLAAGGLFTADQVTEALTPAARGLGLPAGETARTIRSGLTAGARRPRRIA